MKEKTEGQLRHLMTAAGALAVGFGLISEDEAAATVDAVVAAVGAVLVALAHLWSWRSKQ